MPLEKGTSEASLHENIKRLIAEGKSRKQAVAIAYEIQKKAKEKSDDYDLLNCEQSMNNGNRKPHNQAGAANPLGFVYGGIQNQYPFG